MPVVVLLLLDLPDVDHAALLKQQPHRGRESLVGGQGRGPRRWRGWLALPAVASHSRRALLGLGESDLVRVRVGLESAGGREQRQIRGYHPPHPERFAANSSRVLGHSLATER